MPQQWDYDVMVYSHIRDETDKDNAYLTNDLNKMGHRGWENYAVIKDDNNTIFYFKRPLDYRQYD